MAIVVYLETENGNFKKSALEVSAYGRKLADQTKTVKYEKLPPKGEVKLINPENIDDLIDLLHNEAKVI